MTSQYSVYMSCVFVCHMGLAGVSAVLRGEGVLNPRVTARFFRDSFPRGR